MTLPILIAVWIVSAFLTCLGIAGVYGVLHLDELILAICLGPILLIFWFWDHGGNIVIWRRK